MLNFLLVTTSFTSASGLECPSPPNARVERELRVEDANWARANAEGRTDVMKRLLHPEAVIVSGAGLLRSRDEEIEEIRPRPNLTVEYFRTEEVSIKMCGPIAIVVGLARWRIASQDRAMDHVRRYTSIYTRQDSRWQMIHLQVSGRMN